MSALMLINPIGAKKMAATKKRRTAAQIAATKKLVALNRAKRAKRAKHTKRPSAHVGLARATKRASSVARRRRSNPISLRGSGIGTMATESLQGAVGAIAINTALNYMPLPAILKSGHAKHLTRAGAAIALGVFGHKVMGKKIATAAAVGALTVAMHDMMLSIASSAMPTLQLGDVGDYDSGVAEYVSPDMQNGADVYSTMGEYVNQY